MTVTVVHDNSEATELCAAQHLYLKPIAKLMIKVLLPESSEPMRPFSNWEVLDQLKSLICPDQFTTVRLSKSTKDFIRFEGEAETRSLVQILKAKLHGKIIKLNGLKTDLKVVATDAQGEWERFPREKEASASEGAEEQDQDKSPDSIYFEGLPCKWFAPKGSSGEKPCEDILRVVFESFGKIKNVDIPMLDPYREVMTGGNFGGFSFGLQTFEAFIQYQESTDFIKAMESLRGMKLMLKGDDGKALACNIKVMFDTTKHFSEGAIRRRNQERLKLQELEEERKKIKRDEEEAARKRKEEERKAREKRKKARVRRRGPKERDRHRHRKQKARATAHGVREPYSSEEWEERKYLLAQRRVEALRLLRVLLRKIAVRLFLNPSSLLGSTQFNPQRVDDASPKVNHAPENTLETLKKEELNTQYLQNQEEMPKYQVAKSDNKRKQKMKKRTRAHLRKSSHHLGRKKIRYSTRKERTGKLLTDGYNHSVVSDQNSLQNEMIQGQSSEKEDHHNSNKSDSSILSEADHGRKQKIYETDEFIDYLLNYYQTPKYARICLEPSHVASPCQWQRAVHAKGNGFQINLRKRKHHSTSLSQMQNLATRERVQEDDYQSEIYTQDPEHKPQKKGKVDYAKECTEELNHCQDTASEAGDHLSPAGGKSHLLEKMHAYQVKDSKSASQSQVSSPSRSADLDLELTDFLEEISSDSECFSENLSINKEEKERSVATYESSPEKQSLDDDETTTSDREIRSSPQTLYSKWNRDGEDSFSKSKLRKPGKRSKYELRCSWLEGENNSIRSEKSNSKRRETQDPKYLFDEGHYHESGSNSLLDHITRKRRRFGDSTFGQQVNYRPTHVPIASSKSAHVFYLGDLPQRRETPWKSEYNQETRRFKRHEHSKDFMPNSDNYYIRRNSQEHIDYRSYLGSSYTSSLYFQMF
ncbi:A-kinase anchor protein 17B-like isoform X1 [Canis lupus baileyi]|uniref:RRM domain-containing protein n=3 Tax=Canis lupus TaxID=9612 RepID=A0A8C0RFF6_CANLF|nr:A-kinase anchor protein 17B isoform X1 [Canis lupus dingo]XP_025287068.1 A-kinase anchor protein 17B isoform X1 [Canis lupus dingo]XP_038306649.1 A-kinase anchor protein 17B isoform X1 [Canis lupus familiaris]XP_038306650.1 A-kinase anchor protein 17B isoform X1 [Canis lupus familiaris]XP_038444100.1 A-kinase anchor protein 17B isoform X1 [Canis lupus familiaris]XP_038444101.1 A-kinase anchor protein 17B isoform X1 [Canis lupus familiaris]XP_048963843.1 A-kinase anchor protein 17B isoform 